MFVGAVAAATVALLWPRVSVEVPRPDLPWDKAVHLLLFAGLGALGLWARVPIGALVVILAVQAVGTEALQSVLLRDRSGDLADLAVDLLGTAVGIAVAVWARATHRRRARAG